MLDGQTSRLKAGFIAGTMATDSVTVSQRKVFDVTGLSVNCFAAEYLG